MRTGVRCRGMSASETISLNHTQVPIETTRKRLQDLLQQARQRRSVRDFSDQPVPRDVIESCLSIASTAPNGANQQPWHFVAVHDSAIKSSIREAAEEEERTFYESRAPEEWLQALAPLGTDAKKSFLETAPWLIAIFAESYSFDGEGEKRTHYYVRESLGIATGMLIQSLHLAGLVSLTHTPSPMRFLNEILQRPSQEKPFLLLVVGYPAEDARVPKITKKSLEEISTFY